MLNDIQRQIDEVQRQIRAVERRLSAQLGEYFEETLAADLLEKDLLDADEYKRIMA